MFIRQVLWRIAVAGAVATVIASSREASAQGGATQSTPPAAAPNPFAVPPGVKRVPVSKAVFGDAGVIVNARDDGFIEVAAAGPKKTVFLQLRTLAARAWADSTGRMMKARVKRADSPRSFRSDIAEYGKDGKMAMTRTVTNGESEYALSFTDDPTPGFSIPIEDEEADVFVAIIRKAVAQSAKMLEKTDSSAAKTDSAKADSAKGDSTPPKPKKKRAAAKPRASAPAKSDSTKSKPDSSKAEPAKPKP